MSQSIDSARLSLILNDLRLPAIKQGWAGFAERSDREAWPAARFLAALAEHEIAERDRRRIDAHLPRSSSRAAKHLDSFEFEAVPTISRAHVMCGDLAAGDTWIEKGANHHPARRPGRRQKSSCRRDRPRAHREWLARAVRPHRRPGAETPGWRNAELALEAAINRLDRFHLLILDDLAYVSKDQAETSVLFELISARYERRSMLITANMGYGEWGRIIPDPAITLAAVDRHQNQATIHEINV